MHVISPHAQSANPKILKIIGLDAEPPAAIREPYPSFNPYSGTLPLAP
jgi:hypothetical protein